VAAMISIIYLSCSLIQLKFTEEFFVSTINLLLRNLMFLMLFIIFFLIGTF